MAAALTDADEGRTGPANHRRGFAPRTVDRQAACLSADRHCVLIQVSLGTPYLAMQTRETVDRADVAVLPLLADAGPSPPILYVTGPGGIGRDLISASAASLDRPPLATILLVIVDSSAGLSLPAARIDSAGHHWRGHLGRDADSGPGHADSRRASGEYQPSILDRADFWRRDGLLSVPHCRYREELETGRRQRAALGRSIATVGGALAASAGTVMVGLGLMGFAEFGKIRCAGPVIALGLAVGTARRVDA